MYINCPILLGMFGAPSLPETFGLFDIQCAGGKERQRQRLLDPKRLDNEFQAHLGATWLDIVMLVDHGCKMM